MITQTQISAYERCKRFYYLKYVSRLVWPVEVTDRRQIRQGEDFHLLIRQLLMGFPRSSLLVPADSENLSGWLDVFQREDPIGKPDMIFPEREVTVNYADVLWLGKFDALAVYDGEIRIFDWKTSGRKPDAAHYLSSPQTRLYRFLAKTCAARLLGASQHGIPAENIEMVYWFPEYPEETIRLPYSEDEYARDMTWLRTLAREMCAVNEADFPRTEKTRRCEFCDYRTYCFPTAALLPVEDEIQRSDEELIPDDVFQAEFFLPDLPSDSDREETNF